VDAHGITFLRDAECVPAGAPGKKARGEYGTARNLD
jgi:hypothetical protein